MRTPCALVLAFVGTAACVPSFAAGRCEPAALLAAMERVQGGPIHSLQLSGSGLDFVVGQGWRPRGPWPQFNVERYDRSMDFQAAVSSLTTVRSQALDPPRGGARQPLDRGEQTTAVASGSPRATAMRRELGMFMPAGFIEAARRSTDVSAKSLGRRCSLTVVLAEGAPITAELSADGRIERLTSMMTDDVLGDTVQETRFIGSLSAGDRDLPARIVQKVGDYPVLDLQIKHLAVNEKVAIVADVTPPLFDWMAPARMPSEQLGEGLFVMPARYSALAVDLGEYVVLIEAPQSEARTKEVLAEAHRLIPGKPIRYIVNTHAHFDHTAGLRTAVATEREATVVTQRKNIPFLRDVLSRSHTLRPDELARAPRKVEFLAVDDKLSLQGGGREIQLHRLEGMDHVDGMLIAYLPGSKVLVEADAFTPPAKQRTETPASINPYNVQLLDNIERLGLDVDRLISIHYAADGRRVGMDELRLAAGRVPRLGDNHAEHRP